MTAGDGTNSCRAAWRRARRQAAAMVQPTIRTKFADTALWVGNLTTNNDGTAEVSLDMPENLTTWRIKVWGMGQGTRVGQGQTDVVTRKDLIIRMEAPRFFVQTDEVVLSAVVHNYLKTKKSVNVSHWTLAAIERLQVTTIHPVEPLPAGPRGPLAMLDEAKSTQTVEIAPNGEARVDWRVKVLDEGEAVIRMKAITDEESDAMEQRFPCYIHGMSKMDSYCGVIRPDGQSGKVTIDVPEQAAAEGFAARSPLLAHAGRGDGRCPAVHGRLSLRLHRADAEPLPADRDHAENPARHEPRPEGHREEADEPERPGDRQRPANGRSSGRSGPHPTSPSENPVFDVDEVRRMVKDGVERLTEMQCSDGGWGWFSGWGEHSMPHTTAVVVHGLQIAKQNDVALVPGVLERGVAWLKNYQDEQVQWLKNAAIKDKPEGLQWKESADNLDAFVYMVLVDAGVKNADMLDFLYRDRTKLDVYGMAMYGIALDKQGEQRQAGDDPAEHRPVRPARRREPDGVAQHARGLLVVLVRQRVRGRGLLPEAAGPHRSPRRACPAAGEVPLEQPQERHLLELDPRHGVVHRGDGRLHPCQRREPAEHDRRNLLRRQAAEGGRNHAEGPVPVRQQVRARRRRRRRRQAHRSNCRKKGAGPLYYNAYLTTFTLEDFIPKSKSVEIKVARKYYKLVKADKSIHAEGSRGQAVEQKVEKYERQELPNLSVVKSGDLVEIELEIDSKNDYEYLVFEDMKPAGFEPVDLRSGYTGNDLGAYVEFRDNRVVFFARTLARGKHSVSYRMRAEIPGRFSALPTRAAAMYAPELKANSDELKIGVKD